jgi:hypothetical protein
VRRRKFITLFGGAAAAWSLAAGAQQPDRVRRIGVLIGYDETDVEMQIQFAAFRDGLRKLGWTEGGNIRIDTRWATLGDSESSCDKTKLGSPMQQGASVALSADGNTVLIGGPGDSYGAPGAAWVLWRGGVRREVNWQKIAGTGGIGDAQTPIRQGSAVALSADGMTALIGGPGDNRNSGATWVFSIG